MCSATAYYVQQEKNARNLQHESKDARIDQHEVSLCVRSRLNLVKVGVGKLTGYRLPKLTEPILTTTDNYRSVIG